MPLERTIQTNVIDYLNSLPNTRAIKWIQDGRQEGNPDVFCVSDGQAYLFETKQPGRKLEELQEITMMYWERAGAVCARIDHVSQVKEIMEGRNRR